MSIWWSGILSSLSQSLVHQMTKTFTHLNVARGFAEFLVVKVKGDVLTGIYLIVLHFNVPSIDGNT